MYERSSDSGRAEWFRDSEGSVWFTRLTNHVSSPKWSPELLSDAVLKSQKFVWEERTQRPQSIWAVGKKIKIIKFLCLKWTVSLSTCSMAYDELKMPLLPLLELVEESAELPEGVPLPEVFTVRICSSEKPNWWSSFWSLFTVSCKKWFLHYWEGKEEQNIDSG